jgi:hypothetical protein
MDKGTLSMHLRLLLTAILLVTSPAALRAEANIIVRTADDHIDFLIGKELVARYHTGASVAKPYFWPLNAPGEVPLTRAWPMEKGKPGESTDHPHQKSAWFCHGDIIPEGIELKHPIKGIEGVDFWSEAKGHGRIACTGKIDRLDEGNEKRHGLLLTTNEWRTADGHKILDEQRTIHLYNLGDARLFVFDIDLHASVCPVTFGDTKEGSFGIRINDAIREEKGKGKLVNADGKEGEKACWGRVSAWCDYSGPIDDKTVGLAILADPKNPYPTCWHARGYGLMAANPFGRAKSGFPAMKERTDLVKLAKGQHLKLRYGLLLHSGDANAGKVAECYELFVKIAK